MKLARTPWGDFYFWDKDGIGEHISLGRFLDEHLKPVFDEVRPGSVVVDVGANLGWFTVYAAKRGCHVFAFEPCPEVFELLRLNVDRNGVGIHASMFPLALYERCEMLTSIPLGADNPANQVLVDGKLDFNQCRNSGSMAFRPGKGSKYDQYAVPLDYFHLRGVSLIKTDTEGCDLAVLKGAINTISVNRPLLAFEYLKTPEVQSPEDFEHLMDEYGYDAQVALENMDGAHRDYIARPRRP